jgi:hexosaminidase
MKLTTFSKIAALGLSLGSYAIASPVDSVIPLPAKVTAEEGKFSLSNGLSISGPENEVKHLIAGLKGLTGLDFKAAKDGAKIQLILETKSKLGPEAYELKATTSGITVKASGAAGLYYGAQTLIQMADKEGTDWTIPAATINDEPRFAWRGLMLDEGRHFQGKLAVKLLLDNMAARKLNRFHWHLTEDEGWRVEVKGYPELTDIGAWRGKGTQMPAAKWRAKAGLGKNEYHYGGYYTQADLKEIVAYAKERHIEVVPEFDMPGHTNSLVTSLPHLGVNPDPELLAEVRKNDKTLRNWELTGDSPTAYRNNIMNVVKEDTYKFIGDLFDQMADIFPYKYWHVGGDEVRPLYWQADHAHRAVMKEKGFTDPHQLQNMFLLRVEKMMKERGKTMVGWNEIMKGGHMSKDTAVMAWISIGAGIKAAKEGYPTIMAVAPHTYFDMAYPGEGERKGNGWAGQIDSKKAYEWNPLFVDKLTDEEQKRVFGVHACVWTEYVPNPEDMSYKFWPRACSTAEVAWTPQDQRDWTEFRDRLGNHLTYFDSNGTYYRVAPPAIKLSKGKVTIEPGFDTLTTRYTLDGSDPMNGKEYKGETFTAEEAKGIKAVTIAGNGVSSIVVDEALRARVGKFKLHAKKPQTTVTIDITSVLDETGTWQVFGTQDKGHTPSSITSVELLENGKSIASNKANAAIKPGASAAADFTVEKFNKGAQYQLKVTLTRDKAAENVKGMGFFSIDKK